MTATIEISYYPLNNEYPSSVVAFLEKLNQLSHLEVTTTGMSTIVIGDFTYLWNELGKLLEMHFEKEDALAVMKVAAGRREYIS